MAKVRKSDYKGYKGKARIFPYVLMLVLGLLVFAAGFCMAIGEDGNIRDRLMQLWKMATRQDEEDSQKVKSAVGTGKSEAADRQNLRSKSGNRKVVVNRESGLNYKRNETKLPTMNSPEKTPPVAVKTVKTVKTDAPEEIRETPEPSPEKPSRKIDEPSRDLENRSGSKKSGSGKVAIIIDDFGNNMNYVDDFCALDIPITFAILPNLPNSRKIAEKAIDSRKAVILHLPLENHSGINPGPGTLKVNMEREVLAKQFKVDLSSVPGAEGFNNHEGSKVTEDEETMAEILKLASDNSLYFVDSMTSAKSVGIEVASRLSVPCARRDVFLDNEDNVAYIINQLDKLADIALSKGSAIGIGHVRRNTYEALAKAIPEMKKRGVEFVFVRELVQ